MTAEPVKVSVTQLLFAAEDWELLRAHLKGDSSTWKRVEGFRSGELPGALFHNQLAAPFLADLRAGRPDGLAERIVLAAGDAAVIGDRLVEALRDHRLIPLLSGHCRELRSSEILALGEASEQLARALGTLFASFPRIRKAGHVANWVLPPEKLHHADFALPEGPPLRISGKMDAALFDPGKSAVLVVDFKCKTVSKPTTDLLQLALYAWLLHGSTGIPIDGAVLYVGAGGGLSRYGREQLQEVMRQPSTVEFLTRVRDEVVAAQTDAVPHRGAPSKPKGSRKVKPAPREPVPGPGVDSGATEADERTAEVLSALELLGCHVTAEPPIVGPRIIRYKVVPATGKTSVKKIVGAAQDLQIPLKLATAPFIEIAGGYVAIDIPRAKPAPVLLRDLLAREAGRPRRSPVSFPLGVALDGSVLWIDLSDPSQTSVLIGGMAGSGKTEVLKSAIAAMCLRASPEELKLVLVDPKLVSFGALKGLKHVEELIFDGDRTLTTLEEMVADMEQRYLVFQKHEVESIGQYHGKVGAMVHRVLVVDEYADLMHDREKKKELEGHIQRLCQKGRAAGIHLILATQRPDATVVSPLVKANLHIKVGLKVGTRTNSMVILDEPGAETLLGRGDMFAGGPMPKIRLQSPLVTRDELEALGASHAA